MAQSKRLSKTSNRRDKYSAEMSSGQLVIGVLILLVFGLACFLLGVLIGKFDPTLQPKVAQNANPGIQAPEESSPAISSPPEEVEPPRVKKKLPPEMRTTPTPTKIVEETVAEPEKTKTEPSATIPESKREAAPETSVITAEPPSHTTKAIEPTAIAKTTPLPPKVEEPPAAKPDNVVNPANTKKEIILTVQVAAFKIRTNAEKERLRLQKKTPYPVSLMERSGNTWVKVIIGEFTSRESAEKLRMELITQYGFKEIFVTRKL